VQLKKERGKAFGNPRNHGRQDHARDHSEIIPAVLPSRSPGGRHRPPVVS